MLETLVAMGIVSAFAVSAGFLAVGIVNMLIEAEEEENED